MPVYKSSINCLDQTETSKDCPRFSSGSSGEIAATCIHNSLEFAQYQTKERIKLLNTIGHHHSKTKLTDQL